MPMCDGKVKIDSNGVVHDMIWHRFGKEISESRNLELGNDNQTLPDIFLSKLVEGLTGDAEIIKDGDDIRIEYTDKNAFWITITKTIDGYELSADEPAA